MPTEDNKPIKVGNFYPPQIKVAKTGRYRELTDETYNAQSIQTVSADYFEGSGNLTKEFDDDMHGLSIYNDSGDIMRFMINGVSRPVFPKGTYKQMFKDSFKSISITASGQWYIDVLQTIGAAASIVEPEPPDTTAPDNVTNLEYSNVTQNSVTLNWMASLAPDTAGYEIWQGGSLLTTVAVTTFTAVGLTPSTQYTFTVKAKDRTGNVASGTSVNVTTAAQPADTTPPNNVTGLAKSNVTQMGVTLTWLASDSSDLKDYRIYNGSTLIATVTGLTYNVTGLTADTDYTFIVKARDTSNNEASGALINVKTDVAPPIDTTPPVITASPNGGTFTSAQTVTLTANEPATIYCTTNGVDPTEANVYSAPISVTANMTLKFFGKDTAGNKSAIQMAVFVINIPVDPPEPVSNLKAGTPTITTIPITFTKSPSASVTALEMAYSTNGTSFTVASGSINPSSTSYTFTGLTAKTPYWLRVVAIDGVGNRSTAVTVQATTVEIVVPPPINTNLILNLNGMDASPANTNADGTNKAVTWYDQSGQGNNMTIQPSGGSKIVASEHWSSAGFVKTANMAANFTLPFNPLKGYPFSLEIVAKLPSVNVDFFRVESGTTVGGSVPNMRYRFDGVSKSIIMNKAGGSGGYIDIAVPAIDLANYHHICYTVTTTEFKVYLNGQLLQTVAGVPPTFTDGDVNGRVIMNLTNNAGFIRRFRAYGKILTIEEVQNNFAAFAADLL